jgi:hypothetical protein
MKSMVTPRFKCFGWCCIQRGDPKKNGNLSRFLRLTSRGGRKSDNNILSSALSYFAACVHEWVRRHFVPTTNCPTGIFWATNCPRWQNVPLSPHATNCPSDKMSHFLPGDKMSHWWSYWKTIVSLAFFRRQIVPRWQNVPLSPRRQNVPTYALMHMKVMESCWDILSPVKKAIGTICRKWKRPVLGIFRGVFFCQETLQHYYLLQEYKRKTNGAFGVICRHWKRK